MINITCPTSFDTVGAQFTARGDYEIAYEQGMWRVFVKVFYNASEIFSGADNNLSSGHWYVAVSLNSPPPSPSTISVCAELQHRELSTDPWQTVEAITTPTNYASNGDDPCATRANRNKKKAKKKNAKNAKPASTACVLELTMSGKVRPSTTTKPTRLLMRVGGVNKGYKGNCLVLDPFRSPITLAESSKGWIVLQTGAGGHSYDFELSTVVIVPPDAGKKGALFSNSGSAEVSDVSETLFCFGAGTWKSPAPTSVAFAFVPDPRATLHDLRPNWKKLP